MKLLNYICLLGLLLVCAAAASAQNSGGGNVMLHADPRLSVLTTHVHSAEQQTASVVPAKPRPRAKVAAVTGSPVPEAKASKPVSTVSAPVAKTSVKPLPGENGHAAGWTPPVYRKARSVTSGKGFRVQIYNGPDRYKAIAVKNDFMRMYPGVRTYLTYISPGFRVKVGDYKNRSDAAGMLRELNSVFNPSMIVPDIINISTF